MILFPVYIYNQETSTESFQDEIDVIPAYSDVFAYNHLIAAGTEMK